MEKMGNPDCQEGDEVWMIYDAVDEVDEIHVLFDLIIMVFRRSRTLGALETTSIAESAT